MKSGYLRKDRHERYNLKRAWFVNSWRIVDESGEDIIQPWSRTKGEARDVAKKCGIVILGDWPPAIPRAAA